MSSAITEAIECRLRAQTLLRADIARFDHEIDMLRQVQRLLVEPAPAPPFVELLETPEQRLHAVLRSRLPPELKYGVLGELAVQAEPDGALRGTPVLDTDKNSGITNMYLRQLEILGVIVSTPAHRGKRQIDRLNWAALANDAALLAKIPEAQQVGTTINHVLAT